MMMREIERIEIDDSGSSLQKVLQCSCKSICSGIYKGTYISVRSI